MSDIANSPEILEAEFLPMRAKILEIAASLDRIERAEGDFTNLPQWKQIQSALQIVISQSENRAEQLQLHFSRTYDESWRDSMEL